jgi:hypothetical protein
MKNMATPTANAKWRLNKLRSPTYKLFSAGHRPAAHVARSHQNPRGRLEQMLSVPSSFHATTEGVTALRRRRGLRGSPGLSTHPNATRVVDPDTNGGTIAADRAPITARPVIASLVMSRALPTAQFDARSLGRSRRRARYHNPRGKPQRLQSEKLLSGKTGKTKQPGTQ